MHVGQEAFNDDHSTYAPSHSAQLETDGASTLYGDDTSIGNLRRRSAAGSSLFVPDTVRAPYPPVGNTDPATDQPIVTTAFAMEVTYSDAGLRNKKMSDERKSLQDLV
jgi:hypothetical protein